MPIVRAQCVFPYGSGLPEDVITNTFHFDILAGDPDPQLTQIASSLSEFFQDCHAPQGAYANFITWSTAHVNFYLLAAPPPRVPIVRPLAFPGISTSPTTLPGEFAVVCSFQGVPLSGTPQARRRGRVFLGGFASAIASSGTTGPPRVLPALVTQIAQAALELRNRQTSATAPWVVWSPTDEDSVSVDNGWVDNEPDTQRRRGIGASTRSTWP